MCKKSIKDWLFFSNKRNHFIYKLKKQKKNEFERKFILGKI